LLGFYYLLALQAVAFILFGLDKLQAKRSRSRIPESTLLLVTLLGGSLGALGGMYIFRHKTRHFIFRLGVPLMLLIHLAALFYLHRWGFFLS
jgi:uncharacterized membrane protein YsdA (DUF1294 family)